ncbi:MAG: hypothetical protein ABL949_13405 [Fimbriimonadaceae bacterium]
MLAVLLSLALVFNLASLSLAALSNPTTFKNNSRTYNANNQLATPGTNVYDGNGNPTTYNGTSVV